MSDRRRDASLSPDRRPGQAFTADSSDDTVARKCDASPASSSARSISGRFDELARPRGQWREPFDGRDCAGHEREALAIAHAHPAHDLRVDLVGRLGEADGLVHVLRPLGRAHPHHVPLRALVPAPAPLTRDPSRRVPDRLRVEQDSVHVEDDCLDQAACHRPRDGSAPPPPVPPPPARPARPRTCVRPPTRVSCRQSSHPRAPASSGGPGSERIFNSTPPTRDRRDAARSVGDRLGPLQQAEREAGRVEQELVHCCRSSDGDADQGGSEGDERQARHREPEALRARFDGDDGHA